MKKHIQKIKKYLEKYLGNTKQQIFNEFGIPATEYDSGTLIYTRYNKLLFKDEIIFFMEKGRVSDIAITEYFLWIGMRNIFYFKDQNPEYKISKIKYWNLFFINEV